MNKYAEIIFISDIDCINLQRQSSRVKVRKVNYVVRG